MGRSHGSHGSHLDSPLRLRRLAVWSLWLALSVVACDGGGGPQESRAEVASLDPSASARGSKVMSIFHEGDSLAPLPTLGRWGGKSFLWKGKLLAIGGIDFEGTTTVDIYDLATGTITRSPSAKTSLDEPRDCGWGPWVGQISDDEFVLVGGDTTVFDLIRSDMGTYIYNATENQWTTGHNDMVPGGSLFCNYQEQKAIRLDDGRLLVVNGINLEGQQYAQAHPTPPGQIGPPPPRVSVLFTAGPPGHPEEGSWDYPRPGPATALAGDVSDADMSIPVTSTAGFPRSGAFTLGSEIITYAGKDRTHLLGCTRAAEYTTPAAHASGDTVSLISLQPMGSEHFQWAKLTDGRVLLIAGADAAAFNDPVLAPLGIGGMFFDARKHAALFDPQANGWVSVPNFREIPGEDDRAPRGVTGGARQQPIVAATASGDAIVAGGYMAMADRDPDAATALAADVSAMDRSIAVASTDGFPFRGRVMIDAELIDYTRRDGTHFFGCTRGILYFGSIGGAAPHTTTAVVTRIRIYNKFRDSVEDPSFLVTSGPGYIAFDDYRRSVLRFDASRFDAGQYPWVRLADMIQPRLGASFIDLGNGVRAIVSGQSNPLWSDGTNRPYIWGWTRADLYHESGDRWEVGAEQPTLGPGEDGGDGPLYSPAIDLIPIGLGQAATIQSVAVQYTY